MKHLVLNIKSKHWTIFAILAVFIFASGRLSAQDGKALFKQNCAVCHTTTQQKLSGPGLEGITSKRKEEWLMKWIKDSQAFVKSGDADAKTVFEENGRMVMPPFTHLPDEQIKSIIGFLANPVTEPPVEVVAAPASPVVKKETPLSTPIKLFISFIILLVVSVVVYMFVLMQKLRHLGYVTDKRPLSDQVSGYIEQNGKFLLFISLLVIFFVMKSCISNLS